MRVRPTIASLLVAGSLVGMPAVAEARPNPSKHVFDPLELPGAVKMKAKARDGERPRFSWPAVGDAAEYSLVVQTLKGKPYWAWRGAETTVFLGGIDEPSKDASGPILTKEAQWQVIAYAPDGRIVGASPWSVVER
jgi:hypothetical protein